MKKFETFAFVTGISLIMIALLCVLLEPSGLITVNMPDKAEAFVSVVTSGVILLILPISIEETFLKKN